jgi:acetolactate synthase-1/2/3 large subunit
VIRGRASRELVALAERAVLPVVTTFMAKGAIPASHPLHVMTVGLASGDYERAGFAKADVVLAVGYDPVEYGPSQWHRQGQAQVVHVDFSPAEVDARYQPAVEVVADVREALELMAPLVAVRTDREPPLRPPPDPRRASGAYPVLPQRILADLEAVLGADDVEPGVPTP